MVRFEEPSLPALLSLLSLLYVLQVARNAAQFLVGAGLLGEIAVGIIYGPVTHLLRDEWEETLLVIGYIGLCVADSPWSGHIELTIQLRFAES